MFQSETLKIGGIAVERIRDTLPDGTLCGVVKPVQWNGVLLLDLDGAAVCRIGSDSVEDSYLVPRTAMYLAQGYAYGGTTREPVSYRFNQVTAHMLTVREACVAQWGKPKYTLAAGGSRGSLAARQMIERTDVFDGALVNSGGGAGNIAALNSKLNGKWVLNTLVPSADPLRLVRLDSTEAENERLAKLIAQADADALGRARLALAGAVEQISPWCDMTAPEPAADDWDVQYSQRFTARGTATSRRRRRWRCCPN